MGKMGYSIQLAANIGILASLVLLAGQIQQTSDLSRLAFYTEEGDTYVAMRTPILGETAASALAVALEDPESLTTEQILQLDAYYSNVLDAIARRQYLYAEGVYDHPAETRTGYLRNVMGNAFAQAWWSWRRTKERRPNLRAIIDNALEGAESHQQQMVEEVRASILAESNRR